ncbi:MAG TPA: hypothetical protein PLR48_01280, partial [Bacillota bacterium]|nr:hypothetical protein [Bacillota bacterium]
TKPRYAFLRVGEIKKESETIIITAEIVSILKGASEERKSNLLPDMRTNKRAPMKDALILPNGMV